MCGPSGKSPTTAGNRARPGHVVDRLCRDTHRAQWGGAVVGHHRDIERVTAAPDEHAAGAPGVVAGIERVPAIADIRLEPRDEIHRLLERRHIDVGQVSKAVARRNVEPTKECDRKMGEVAADTCALEVDVGRSRGRAAASVPEGDVVMHPVDNRLDALPSGLRRPPNSCQAVLPSRSDSQYRLARVKCSVESGRSATAACAAVSSASSTPASTTTSAS